MLNAELNKSKVDQLLLDLPKELKNSKIPKIQIFSVIMLIILLSVDIVSLYRGLLSLIPFNSLDIPMSQLLGSILLNVISITFSVYVLYRYTKKPSILHITNLLQEELVNKSYEEQQLWFYKGKAEGFDFSKINIALHKDSFFPLEKCTEPSTLFMAGFFATTGLCLLNFMIVTLLPMSFLINYVGWFIKLFTILAFFITLSYYNSIVLSAKIRLKLLNLIDTPFIEKYLDQLKNTQPIEELKSIFERDVKQLEIRRTFYTRSHTSKLVISLILVFLVGNIFLNNINYKNFDKFTSSQIINKTISNINDQSLDNSGCYIVKPNLSIIAPTTIKDYTTIVLERIDIPSNTYTLFFDKIKTIKGKYGEVTTITYTYTTNSCPNEKLTKSFELN